MNHRLFFHTLLLAAISLFCMTSTTQAAPKYIFKVATLAPAGSIWINQLEKFAEEVNKKTDGNVGFKIYPGGVMGDDQAMLRKMRVGQLHGGGFTMTGISAAIPDFRALSIPFLFESYEEIDFVKKGLIPEFKKKFAAKGMEFIAMTEVGFIYAMSTQPIADFTAFTRSKSWTPSGDPVSETYLKVLGISPVQLTIPDVTSSLQSGLIDTVFNSLYGSIVMQWFTRAKYIVNFPYGYAYGVFALSSKKFKKLPDEYQEIIKTAAAAHFPQLLELTRKSNQDSREVLKKQGTTYLDPDKETLQKLQAARDLTLKELVPKAMSEEIVEKTLELVKKYRQK